jgi:uncharacterized membrane protein YgcG
MIRSKRKKAKKSKPKSFLNEIKKHEKFLIIALVILIFATFSFAQESIIDAMKSLCQTATALLATGAMLLVILAAAVYAIGQMVGAETRARASVWATAMITGALIGIVIYLILPGLIELMLGEEIDCASGGTEDTGSTRGGDPGGGRPGGGGTWGKTSPNINILAVF